MNSANIIGISKCHFARYGLLDELITDNAAAFSSLKLATFASTCEFCHTTVLSRPATVGEMARQKVQSKLPNDCRRNLMKKNRSLESNSTCPTRELVRAQPSV